MDREGRTLVQISYITAEMNEDFTRAVEVGARTDVEVVSLRSPVWDCDLEHLERDLSLIHI